MNENQFGVILESILDKVNGIAEGQKVMAEGQSKLEERFDRLEGKVDRLETKMDNLESDVKMLKNDVKIIKSYMVSFDEGLNDRERRITTLEKVAQA